MNHQRQRRARCALADHIEGFTAVDAQDQTAGAGLELQRQHTHADQIGAVNTLEPFCSNHFDARQPDAFGRPVTGRALPIVGTGNDDQRLLARHVGFDGFPHARDHTFGFDTGQRAFFDLAVDHCHLVDQLRVGKGRALGGQVVAPMGCIGVEVFLR